MEHFGDLLAGQVQQKKSAVCVGIDPRWKSLPESIRAGVDSGDRSAVAKATECYCREVIDAVASVTPVVKPQAAFFELLGPAGMLALAGVIKHATKAGVLVLLDGKRGDIGSTAEGYADAYLGRESAWGCDALTVNPYLGDDTLEPFVHGAVRHGAGIFVLVKTSNPGSGFLQDQVLSGENQGQTVFERMADLVQSHAAATQGTSGYGAVGAVVGATYPQQLAALRQRMPNAWILIPGFGAQGGTAADVAHGFDSQGRGAIVNSSRGVIFAYQSEQYKHLDWQSAVAKSAHDMAQQLGEATPG
ncbi:orotidine-5'-phosphate decarboxylase [Aureliella helgolandensis]|uniref:Orotidine 5'-phosphate decarboxylase n=1 Tax=Aureliella helgolandensis TaxID=2527968 RepID=A0A518GCC2_9BACT|nr:orotidine-5'-phosphate decarboxylase [Aureliella helgolandensis]QDV26245.1 Orotidine 5'-phosphate decarboxylase [Aureliella helgolandensis]